MRIVMHGHGAAAAIRHAVNVGVARFVVGSSRQIGILDGVRADTAGRHRCDRCGRRHLGVGGRGSPCARPDRVALQTRS